MSDKEAPKRSPTFSSPLSEKGRQSQVEVADGTMPTPVFNPDIDVSAVDEKKLIRKIDFALIPWLSFLYLLSFLDRTSIGNAKVSVTKCSSTYVLHSVW